MSETTRNEQYYLVFDVESVGLHGDGFAVGCVLLAPDGFEVDAGLAWCDPEGARNGFPEDRAWVKEHVAGTLRRDARKQNLREVRDFFWEFWRSCPPGTLLAADVAWPVEARFLAACIDDDPSARNWQGPYPLLDIASVRYAIGLDPLATEPRELGEEPPHNPLTDARQSARLFRAALNREAPTHAV